MSKNWKNIWNNKTINKKNNFTLLDLIRANGFDHGVGDYSTENWKKLVLDILKRVEFSNGKKMLEIGCGSGAFIYCSNKYFKANYYGIDYSQNLINIAKKVLPNSNLILSEANSIPFNQVKFDVILSHSVFQYFVNHKYAFEVINEAFKKLNDNGSFCLLDLNDKKFENNYFIERKKKYKNYETAYKNLNHLFFDKIEIENYLLSIGFQKINFFPHAVKEYGNSNYRFNLIAKK